MISYSVTLIYIQGSVLAEYDPLINVSKTYDIWPDKPAIFRLKTTILKRKLDFILSLNRPYLCIQCLIFCIPSWHTAPLVYKKHIREPHCSNSEWLQLTWAGVYFESFQYTPSCCCKYSVICRINVGGKSQRVGLAAMSFPPLRCSWARHLTPNCV